MESEHYSKNSQNMGVLWSSTPSFVIQGTSRDYTHWMLDDMFGFWWMRHTHFPDMDPRSLDTALFWYGDSTYSAFMHMLSTFFSSNPVRSMKDMKLSGSTYTFMCFEQLVIGPAQHHLGGPGVSQLLYDPKVIRFFSTYMLNAISVDYDTIPIQPQVLFSLRRGSRTIINEDQLRALAKEYDFPVKFVYFEDLSVDEQLRLVHESTVLIGMYGSNLANLVFLPEGATVIQLFPYNFYRPTYNYISKLASVNILEWRNDNIKQTVFHPELLREKYPNLKDPEVLNIINSPDMITSSVAADYYWLTQDTRVPVQMIREKIDEALNYGINTIYERTEPSQELNVRLKDEL
eukprot:CAMPEP_0174266518 /NCGR_PEP_ID=MMETSP0439-20130205/30532_1 /TAXON_ID=0 /ORGANISM="Stereomyxa ramosa, Strain Chinc5" /LENGTH=346 /DNA_ID=CAMNT_0015353535 /DNA_START=245 /DNA_END=1285 /DNA_ORIENTATION=-